MMNRLFVRAALVVVAICPFSPTSLALAQQWSGLQNRMIETTYVPPTNPNYEKTYETFKKRQVLEELSAFLSPLRLPYTLPIKMLECGTTNSYYVPSDGLHLCYELPEYVSRIAPAGKTSDGVTRKDVIVGTFVQITLHEVGHAVFNMLQIPIFGREEDAADQIAAFVMLQFGKDLARRTLTGTAHFWQTAAAPRSRTAFADEHGTHLQRFYNTLCIAYGGQPDTFKDLVEAGALPKERAVHCGREYEQVRSAFAKTIWPHLDLDLLNWVRSIDWAKWEGEQ